MMNHNLYELISTLHNGDESLFPTLFINNTLNNTPLSTWVNKYYKGVEDYFYRYIDDYIADKYGSFIPVSRYTGDVNAESRYLRTNILPSFFIANIDKLNHIIELSMLEYDPISNYDKTEIITTEYTGEEVTTNNIGERITSTNNGERVYTITNEQSPYNDNNYYNDSKSTTNNNQYNDTTTDNARTDASTHSYNGRTDTTTTRTTGNIGVTTTVAMMKEGVDFWKTYNIVDTIMGIFVANHCTLIDE